MMKQTNTNIYHKLLAALVWLLLAAPGAWAQGGTGSSSYAISGEAYPTDPDKQYDYSNQLPGDSDGVYWYVAGAATINGDPADSYQEGSLKANEHNILTIQWDSKTDSSFVLQLRRQSDGKPPEVLTEFNVRNTFSCTGHILYYGLRSAPVAPGTTANQTVCAPPLPPVNTVGELYTFSYDTPNCGNGFIWTIKYHTTTGQVYVEQWFENSRDAYAYFSTPRQIPQYLYSTPQASFITPHNFNGTPGTTLNPMYGQPVTSIDVQCSGYSCGFWNCTIDDEMHFFYTGPLGAPGAIAVSGGTQPLCRNQVVSLSTGGSIGATGSTNYIWSSSSPSVVFSGNSGSVTANLANVSASSSSVIISVRASNTSSACGTTTSATTSTTIQLAAAPNRPQDVELVGRCPDTSPKTVRVINAPNGQNYNWSVTGTGATFDDNGVPRTTLTNRGPIQALTTTSAANVVVSAVAVGTACNGNSLTTSQTFAIGSAALPTQIAITVTRSQCSPSLLSVAIQNPQAGLLYSMSRPYNVVGATSVTLTQTAIGSPTATINWSGGPSNGPGSFAIDITATSNCPFAQTPPLAALGSMGKFIQGLCRAAPTDSSGTKSKVAESVILYPNPTDGQVNVTAEPGTTYQWANVMDSQGRVVQTIKDSSKMGVSSFDIHALPAGLYEIQLFDGTRLTTRRIAKQ